MAGNTASNNPDMSADGSHIVFESLATNLTTSNSLNHIYYVNTSVAHTVEQISVATGGAEANAQSNKPSISNDGSTIVFHSDATNLDGSDDNGSTDVYLHYVVPGSTELISANSNTGKSGNGASSNAHISGNADYVVFESLASDLASGSTLGVNNILVRDLSAWPGIIIEKVDIPSSTLPSNEPAISADGRYVSFHSDEAYTADDSNSVSDVYRAHNSTLP
jgi:Tol biopolymer transport system component